MTDARGAADRVDRRAADAVRTRHDARRLDRRRQRKTADALLAAAFALPLAIVAVAAWWSWRDAWRSAEQELTRTADAAAAYTERVLGAHRLAAELVNHMLAGLSDEEIRAREAGLHESLRRLLPKVPMANTIALSDRNAVMLLTANVMPVPQISIADREWVRELRRPDHPPVQVSAITTGRIDDNFFFGVSVRRALSGNGLPQDAFDGVVNVSVNPIRLAEGLETVTRGPSDVIALVRADGELLARNPFFKARLPPIRPDSPLRAAAAAGERRGLYTGRTFGLAPDQTEGETRLVAFHRVGDLPVYAMVVRPPAAIAARWHQAVAVQLAIGVPAALALAGLALLVRRGQRGLAESEADFRAAFEQSAVAMAQADPAEHLLLRVNPEFCRLVGQPEAEVLGRPFGSVVHPEDSVAGLAALSRVLRQEEDPPAETELRYLRPDGTVRWARIGVSVVRDRNGQPVRILVVARDITGRKAAEMALQQGEARLRIALDAGRMAVWELDVSNDIITVSPELNRLLGFPPEAMPTAEAIRSRYYPGERERLQGIVQEMLARGDRFGETEFRYLWPDGSVRWIMLRAEILLDPAGRPSRYVGVALDITDRKHAEEALREGEERLRATYGRAPVGIAEADRAGRLVRVNDAYCRIIGYSREELLGGLTIHDVTHPDDVGPDLENHRLLMAGEVGAYTLEKRFIRRDNGIVWAELSASAVRGADGRPAYAVRIVQDLSKRRRAEAALRSSEERLRRAAEAARFATFDLDRAGTAVTVSDNFRSMWGLGPEAPCDYDALLARVHPADRPRVQENRRRMAAEGGTFEIEFRVLGPDGAIRWLQSRGEGEPGSGDLPGRIVGVNLDITERREAEERQWLLMRELDHRAKNALAVVQAALRLTPRDDPSDFVRAVEGRVAALARAHTLLAKGRWSGADLRIVIQGELAPILGPEADQGLRIALHGPSLRLTPGAVQALSMAMHELATNAAKHGALSVPTGRIEIGWDVVAATGGDMLRIRWAEAGGPVVPAGSARRGFGSSLIEATVVRQLGGRVTASLRPEGLLWEAAIPLRRVASSTDGAEAGSDAQEAAAAAGSRAEVTTPHLT